MIDIGAIITLRVLIYGINFAPEPIGIGKCTGELATWFAKQQDKVWVITTPPYYPYWQIQCPYCAYCYYHEYLSKQLSVLRCPLWVPARPSGVARILHLLSFMISSSIPLLWQVGRHRPDYIIVIAPSLLSAFPAWLASKLCATRLCLHVQDFEVEAAFALGMIKCNLMRRWILAAESWIMRRFDQVSTISRPMLDKLYRKGVLRERCVLFPNWVDTQLIKPLTKVSPYRNEWHIPREKLVLLYSGNMGNKQGLEVIVDVAKVLQNDSRLLFVMCGEGAFYQSLCNLARGVDNIIWQTLQPANRLNDLLNLADVHLLPQRVDVADVVMPSKLTGMLASARPVIATAKPGTQIAEIVTGSGLVVLPGDVKGMVNAILILANDSTMRNNLGKQARQYALRYLDKQAILTAFRQSLNHCS